MQVAAGKASFLVAAPVPPVIMSPAIGKLYVQTTITTFSLNCVWIKYNYFTDELQIRITSWAIVSLAGGRLGKVEVEERQGEKEKNHPSHLQQADLR